MDRELDQRRDLAPTGGENKMGGELFTVIIREKVARYGRVWDQVTVTEHQAIGPK